MPFNQSLGLDFHDPLGRSFTRVRMAVFRDFVELAIQWKKPLILHVRQATVEAIQVMTEVSIRFVYESDLSENNTYMYWTIVGRPSVLLADSPPLLQ